MGNYNLKSNILRCEKCFSIFRMKIDPGLPESYVDQECKCTTTRTSIKNFLSELTKNTKYRLKCVDCRSKTKEEKDKNALYCNDCSNIYCDKCISKNHKNHNYINLLKLDFYCVFHQKENFCAFCPDCDINICKKCLSEEKHLNHDIIEYDKIMLSKNERNFLKEKFNLAQEKMTFNENFVNALCKKMKKKDDIDKLINIEKDNTQQNKLILELIKFFEYLYDNSRFKNYNIIYNFIDNINLNVNKFKFWNTNIKIEDALDKIMNYFKEDFILINTEKNLYSNIENAITDLDWDINDIYKRNTINNFNNYRINIDEDIKINNKKSKENKDLKINNNNIDKQKKINQKNKINNEVNNNNTKSSKISKNKNDKKKDIIKKNNKTKVIKEKTKKSEPDIINNEEDNNKIKNEEGNNKTNNEEKMKIFDNKENKEEILNDKEQVKDIEEEEIKEKNEIKQENEIENKMIIQEMEKINNNKYINLLSINRFRIKIDSNINLMMVNGFRNKKIYDINININ